MSEPSSGGPPGSLSVADILDLRAYERVRPGFLAQVMAQKRRRRVPLGEIMTLVFESVDTVRFQIQEMARVEKIATDEGIQAELDVYNRLLPTPGELSATLFIELTTDADLRRWLPQLVGIESQLGFDLGPGGSRVPSVPETAHAHVLTREEVTPAVHYLRFVFTPAEIAAFATGPVALVADHPAYRARSELAEATHQELLGDLEGRTVPLDLA
jgi:hypothetical protein